MEFCAARNGSFFGNTRRVEDFSGDTRRVGGYSPEINTEKLVEESELADDGTNTHWLLTHSRITPENRLSTRQMESLVAICDTFLPSIPIYNYNNNDDKNLKDDESVKKFYATSASMAGTPQYVGGLLSGGVAHPMIGLLGVALWFLSTWFGTLFFCGWASISWDFPYFHSFSQLPRCRREQIILSWSQSSIYILRILYKGLTFLIMRVFFTQLDEKKQNVAWEALGYYGPDPDFINKREKSRHPPKEEYEEEDQEKQTEEQRFGPLHKSVIKMDEPRSILIETLLKSKIPAKIRGLPGKRHRAPREPPSLTLSCDAVVVGSGSGGGVVAGVLAKAGYKVVVLEKGHYFARGRLSLLEGPTTDQMYDGGGMIATNDLSTVILAGSTVGGGSAINWSASIRTPSHVSSEWCEELDLELFGSKAYERALDIVCERMGVQSEITEEGFNNEVLRRGCLELGYPVNNIPRNSPSDHYCGWCQLGCKDGRKKGTQETWLVDLAQSGNGVILPNCKALKVLQEKKNDRMVATGVLFEYENGLGGKEVHVVESKVTVLACGALRTPVLLKTSGLKNPNIGKHLHLHPTVMAWGYFPSAPNGWPDQEKKSYEGGIMTAMSTVVANFKTSGYGAVIQTPSLHPGMFSAVTPWVSGLDMKDRMTRFSRTAHIFALARDKGSGEVDYPKSLTYRLDSMDEENLQKGLEKTLRILTAAGAEEIGTNHCSGDRLNVRCASSHELERFVKSVSSRGLRDLSTPLFSAHQMGSCRMGVNPKGSVVNQRGETWEVEGLFVADTSVFPTALGVNPMVTVQAISYCTAEAIVEILRRKKIGK